MTQKDYVMIAEVLRKNMLTASDRKTVASIVAGFANKLQSDNSRFDRERFYKACGFMLVETSV